MLCRICVYFGKSAILNRCVNVCACIHCHERDNRNSNYSKLTACFNDVVNPARFTAADALRFLDIRFQKRYLTSHLIALTIEF